MHRIKAQARRHAWYNNEDEGPNYNPFAKHGIHHVSSRNSVDAVGGGDLEAGRPSYNRATSESAYRSQENSRRESQFEAPGRTFSDRQRLPPLSSDSASPRRSLNFQPGHSKEGEDGNRQDGDAAHTESTDTSGTLTEKQREDGIPAQDLNHIDTAHDLNAGARKRRLGGLLGLSKDKGKGADDGDNLEEVDTQGKQKRQEPNFTWQSQIRHTIFNSPINILLLASPIGIALSQIESIQPEAIFAINFIAIIPLAALLSFATEEIALRTGETIGGLLNASFGNATELIVSIIALTQNQITITKTSLIGSMLSNLLLVLGMCFFFGGLTRVRQKFNVTVAQTASSILALALAAVIIPSMFDQATSNNNDHADYITAISHGISVLLLLCYGCYLFFQLKTHSDVYNATGEKQPKRTFQKGDASKNIGAIGGMLGFVAPTAQEQSKPEDDEEEVPKLSLTVALITLAASTALIAANSEFMVDQIPYLGNISPSFLGLILIPIVGNAAEHATAVTVACKDKMDLAIGVAVGSSMQIALLVLPICVIIGWGLGVDNMNLDFDLFQVAVLFISILLVNYLISDGESHWLEGILLMLLYTCIALAAWYYPADACEGNFCNVNANGTTTGAAE